MTTSEFERLSRAQTQILLLAYANHIEERRTAESPGADLYYSQVLGEVYGFRPIVGGGPSPGCIRFDRQAIGPARYNAAASALSQHDAPPRGPRPHRLPMRES
jgi:hypothetical protein